MPIDLFVRIPVTDYQAAREWYKRLFGKPPSFLPAEADAVWELAEPRFVYIVQWPERAGRAAQANGIRKITFRDADGNEFSFGGATLP